MLTLSTTAYLWIRALHMIAVIAWMAGLFYLPRLFVYHAGASPGSELSETFKVMERRLLRAIMNPAMAASLVLGLVLLGYLGTPALEMGWIWVKLAAAAGLVGLHMALARWRREFAEDRNRRPARFYRVVNEVPTALMAVIVVMVTVRPF